MKKLILFLCFTTVYLQAQKIEDQETLKKCRKEFNRKICLSDEDHDNVLFYLDKCPTEAGPVENQGCLWTDTDKDGVLDKDDACTNIPGVPELNGCPSKKNDCKEYREKADLRFKKFKTDYANIEAIYDKINRIALDAIIKKGYIKALANKESLIFLKYINNTAYFDQNSCYDGSNPEYNFLISKFWNKNFLEYARKKYNKDIYLSTKIPPEDLKLYHDIGMSNETFDYITKYYDWETMKIKIPGNYKSVISASHSIPTVITFITPYQIKVEDPKKNIIMIYEYKNNKWELIKE